LKRDEILEMNSEIIASFKNLPRKGEAGVRKEKCKHAKRAEQLTRRRRRCDK
jgi:hypothetical protein